MLRLAKFLSFAGLLVAIALVMSPTSAQAKGRSGHGHHGHRGHRGHHGHHRHHRHRHYRHGYYNNLGVYIEGSYGEDCGTDESACESYQAPAPVCETCETETYKPVCKSRIVEKKFYEKCMVEKPYYKTVKVMKPVYETHKYMKQVCETHCVTKPVRETYTETVLEKPSCDTCETCDNGSDY